MEQRNQLSVLIADDEPGIIDLIKMLMDTSKMNLHIVGEATNGVEAFHMIREWKPDVVITDIRMPGMTGLQLIEKASVEYPSTAFIIISGYREFEYAQAALKYGTADYLLKPIKKNELNGVLERLAQKKGAEEKQKDHMESMERKLSQTTELLRKKALRILEDSSEKTRALAVQSFLESKVFSAVPPGGWCGIARVLLDDPSRGEEMPSSAITEAIIQKIAPVSYTHLRRRRCDD